MTIRGDRRPTGYLVDDDLARQRTLTSPTPSDPAGPAPPGDAAVATSPGEAAGPASPGDPAMQDAPLAPGHAAVATPAGDAPGSEAPADDHGATVGPPPGNGSGATGSRGTFLPAALRRRCAAHAGSQSPSVEIRDAGTFCRRQLEPGASTPW